MSGSPVSGRPPPTTSTRRPSRLAPMNGIVQNVYDLVSEMSATPQLLPSPAPARLRRDEVAASQRGRMLRAMAEAASERGYVNTVVSDVVERAGVSRKTFYEHFTDKEECFLASYDA